MPFVATLILIASLVDPPDPGTAARPAPTGRYVMQLAEECRALTDQMIRRPYGAGWPADKDSVPQTPREARLNSIPVSMQPLDSPAAGFVLLLAGDFLRDDSLRDAARAAARGAAASLTRTGMVLSRPTFGPVAGGREDPTYISRRDATQAALGLMMASLDATPEESRDDIVQRSAMRAVSWLLKQQARNGAFPTGYPADVPAKDASRILRFDTPDYRNAVFTLMAAGDILDNRAAAHAATRAADILLRARLANPLNSNGLWSTAYSVDGIVLEPDFNFPDGADVVASRYVLQALIATYLKNDDPTYRSALIEAATTLAATRDESGKWARFPDPGLARPPSSKPVRGAASTRQAFEEPYPVGSFGMESTLNTISELKLTARDKYMSDACALLSERQQLCASIVGLLDSPFELEAVRDTASGKAFVAAHSDWWVRTEGPVPKELSERIKRLWALLLRAKLESEFGV